MKPEQFKAIREKFGLTQGDLAEVFGIATLTVSQYETGRREISMPAQILMSLLYDPPIKSSKEFLGIVQEHCALQKRTGKRKKNV